MHFNFIALFITLMSCYSINSSCHISVILNINILVDKLVMDPYLEKAKMILCNLMISELTRSNFAQAKQGNFFFRKKVTRALEFHWRRAP